MRREYGLDAADAEGNAIRKPQMEAYHQKLHRELLPVIEDLAAALDENLEHYLERLTAKEADARTFNMEKADEIAEICLKELYVFFMKPGEPDMEQYREVVGKLCMAWELADYYTEAPRDVKKHESLHLETLATLNRAYMLEDWQAVVVFYKQRSSYHEVGLDQVGELERLLKHQWGFLFEKWEPGMSHPLQ